MKSFDITQEDTAVTGLRWTDMPVEVVALVKTLEEGGGGFSNSGRKEGYYSESASTITFTLRCKSAHAWGCKHQVRIVVKLLSKTIKVERSTGWPHCHTGTFLLKRGLPPQVFPSLSITSISHVTACDGRSSHHF